MIYFPFVLAIAATLLSSVNGQSAEYDAANPTMYAIWRTFAVEKFHEALVGGNWSERIAPEPYTLFAFTDRSVLTVGLPKNSTQLREIVERHIVPGLHTEQSLRDGITSGGGSFSLTTVSGDTLVITKASVDDEVGDFLIDGSTHILKGKSKKAATAYIHQVDELWWKPPASSDSHINAKALCISSLSIILGALLL